MIVAFRTEIMPSVTIRHLSADALRVLKGRAKQHGHSTEAEMRDILEEAARPNTGVRLGTALAELSRRAGLTNHDVDAIVQARTADAAVPFDFE